MHVGLNMIFLTPGAIGGMEVYARELAPRLAATPGLRVTAFVGREAAGEDFGVERVVLPVTASSRAQWVAGEQLVLPRAAARHGCDVVHSLASTAPVRGRFRRVVTIHDLLYAIVPDAHFGLRALGMRALVPAAARSSHRVIAISAATRDDVHARLHVPLGRIDTVLQGVSAPVAAPTPKADLRRTLELGERPVLLTFSAKRPHKNLLRLIDALATLEDRPLLVLPGYPTEHEQELRDRAAALGVIADVRFPGWISEADREGLYALATAFVFPSLYEGFGLPVLEAMQRGVPVATSDRGSLAEVAGDAALRFDPEDTGAIAAAVARLLAEPALREDLVARGARQAAAHGWDRTAAGTVAAYRRA